MSVLRALFIRHAEHALQDRVLVGRSPGVELSARGLEQARALARTLDGEDVRLVQTSPRRRCVATAEIIGRALGIPVTIAPALDELDFGAWTGAAFAALAADPQWHRWNTLRSQARAPGGESMAEAQTRLVSHLDLVSRSCGEGQTAMVTHAEIIRAALLHDRDLPLDAWSSIPIEPCSVSRLAYPRTDGATSSRAVAA